MWRQPSSVDTYIIQQYIAFIVPFQWCMSGSYLPYRLCTERFLNSVQDIVKVFTYLHQ